MPMRLSLQNCFVLLICLLAVCLQCGCNVASTVAYITTPNPVMEARYELKDESTVIFIDDRRSRVSPVRLRRTIGDVASEGILKEELVVDVISPRDATAAARQLDKGPKPAAIGSVGKMVGADQVIYVEMVEFRLLGPDGYTPDPYASCQVRVVDLVEKKRQFPDPEKSLSHTVEVRLPQQKSLSVADSRARQKLGELLATETGVQIARLFYDHEVPAVGANLLYGDR